MGEWRFLWISDRHEVFVAKEALNVRYELMKVIFLQFNFEIMFQKLYHPFGAPGPELLTGFYNYNTPSGLLH